MENDKQKKIVGECPICKETFRSRAALEAHMEDPPNHPPAVDLDVQSTGSFGEVSSDYSTDEETAERRQREEEQRRKGKTRPEDQYEEEEHRHQHEEDEEDEEDIQFLYSQKKRQRLLNPLSRLRTHEGEAVGILYCATCDRSYGNVAAFQRHFMFSAKHGEDPADFRDIYYNLWRKSWGTAPATGNAEPVPSEQATTIDDPMDGVLSDDGADQQPRPEQPTEL